MGKQQRKRQGLSPARRLELFLAACLYYSGLVSFGLWCRQRSGATLTILCYHEASNGFLREHLLYLRRHYRLLHLEQALEELFAPEGEIRLIANQRPWLALTFDDGYRDFSTCALPLARELQVPLTCFLIPGYVENTRRFWWLEPEYLVSQTREKVVTLGTQIYHLEKTAERDALCVAIEAGLRFAPSIEAREAFLEAARTALHVSDSLELDEEEQQRWSLNWTEIHELDRCEWISFGAHTMHHPILAYLTDPAELQDEVGTCRIILEQQLGHSIHTFAYPVGKEEHIATRGVEAVRTAMYRGAVTTLHGINRPSTDPHYLSRVVVDVDQHWLLVAVKASGVWDFLIHRGFLRFLQSWLRQRLSRRPKNRPAIS